MPRIQDKTNRRTIMAYLTVEIKDKTMFIRSQAFCCEFQDTDENQKALFVFLRLLSCPDTGKKLFTYQQIADAFGKNDRRDIHNFVRDFVKRGGDFLQYLARKNTKKDRLLPLIEIQVLDAPLLSPTEHYRLFCEEHPQEKLCEQTFRNYVNEIAVTKILKRVRRLGFKKEPKLDVRRYLQELIELPSLSRVKRKEVVESFPEVEPVSTSQARRKPGEHLTAACLGSKLLVVVLYACGLSQDMLSLLFGVSKTSIHHWLYSICSEDLDWDIIRDIARWSGQVSFDEKWVKINGVWHFVLCAVDSVSGFPLLMDLYPTLDTVSWTLFFKRFKALYGLPHLIQSDGSRSLAAGRETVFSRVRYQLCTFHKLNNLMKHLRQYIQEPKLLTRCNRLAKHIFSNKWVSSRKKAAQTLQKLSGEKLASYIDEHILGFWRNLTMSLTSNVSERFNRKIEKSVSARYGIPSVESARVILRSLWLKEVLLNGQHHIDAISELRAIDLSKICQEHVDTDNILHFFHDYNLSQAKRLA
jgi:transposase-like protein